MKNVYHMVNLSKMIKESNSDLEKAIMNDFMKEGENNIIIYLKKVIIYGGVGEVINSLRCSKDINDFFKKHCIEIIEYAQEWEEQTGEALNWDWNINDLVWFIYGDMAQKVLGELLYLGCN